MAYALNPSFSPRLRSLISNDMAPWIGKISPEFRQYAQGMKEVEEAKVGSKKEADAILQKYEKVSGWCGGAAKCAGPRLPNEGIAQKLDARR